MPKPNIEQRLDNLEEAVKYIADVLDTFQSTIDRINNIESNYLNKTIDEEIDDILIKSE